MVEVRSRSVTQPLLLLSVVAGSMVVMDRRRMFSRLDMKTLVRKTYDDVSEIILKWPTSGNEVENAKWIEARRKEWFDFINEDQTVEYNLQTLACVCDRIITDLLDRIHNSGKKALVASLVGPINKIHHFADAECRNLPAYEQSGFILDRLYELAGWNWDK